MYKKEYLAFTDLTITEIISQKNQMKLMKNYLNEHNADIVFYSTEGHRTIESMRILENKIGENPNIDGIVFYSILQFSYSGKFLSQITKKPTVALGGINTINVKKLKLKRGGWGGSCRKFNLLISRN